MAITVPTDAYCTLAEALDYLPQVRDSIGTSTDPITTSEAEQVVKDVAKQMDAVIGKHGYDTPVTDTDALPLLRRINSIGAAGEILLAFQGGLGAALDENALSARYAAELKRLERGAYKLGSLEAPSYRRPDGQADLLTGGDREDPTFTSDMRW